MTLKEKVFELLKNLTKPNILFVVDTEDLAIFSDIEVERFNLLLDTIKLTTITGGAL